MRISTGPPPICIMLVICLLVIHVTVGCTSSLEAIPAATEIQAHEVQRQSIQPQFLCKSDFENHDTLSNIGIDERSLTAVGSGLSDTEARNDALSSLSGLLYSQVVSSIESEDMLREIDGKVVHKEINLIQDISITSNLPILGAYFSDPPQYTYDVSRGVPIYQIRVILNPINSLPLYEKELERLALSILDIENQLEHSIDSLVREEQLTFLLEQYTQFEKLAFVAFALGSTNIPKIKYTRTAIEFKLLELGRINDSYEKAAQKLTKDVFQDGVYVYPAKLNNSGGVTEFAEQLSRAMEVALGPHSVTDPVSANYYFFGSYTLKEDGNSGIYVTYRLEDTNGNVISANTLELLPSAYEGQRFMSMAYDFQKQLERGDSVDNDFSIDIRINGMKDYLVFASGDELIIEVKSNAPCYFYVMGYVFNEMDKEFSYLFPLKLNAVGKDMFVHHISPEDVNKWIIINPTQQGKILPIEVIEPYGVEMLQVNASTQKKLSEVSGNRTRL